MYTLLLTTRERRSGRLRRTALIYGQDGERYLVAASNGGKPENPGWYLNLVEHPEVDVRVGWQSEFLAVGSLIVLSIVLRQRGSPQSKPVTAPHSQTGV